MVPGWTSRALHRGQLPFAKLPAAVNPPAGFLQNCNVAANVVTPGLKFTQKDFPPGILNGHYSQYRARGQRATRLLAGADQATLADGRRIAFDNYVPPADLWVPVILQAHREHRQRPKLKLFAADEALLAEAARLLRQWNRFATRQSAGATVFRFWRLACAKMKPPVGRDASGCPTPPRSSATPCAHCSTPRSV
jgi:acyl-homoserine lactone acylase PvdQ